MKSLTEYTNEGLFTRKQKLKDHENPQEIIYNIIQEFIFAFEEYGKYYEDELDIDDFFSKIYGLFDKEDGFDSVCLLYKAWVNNTINRKNIDKFVKTQYKY